MRDLVFSSIIIVRSCDDSEKNLQGNDNLTHERVRTNDVKYMYICIYLYNVLFTCICVYIYINIYIYIYIRGGEGPRGMPPPKPLDYYVTLYDLFNVGKCIGLSMKDLFFLVLYLYNK